MNTDQACACNPVAHHDYDAKGTWIEGGLNGLKTYHSPATGGTSKKAILLLYDVFGFCPQNYQGADMMASNGFDVYIPDVFKGGALDFKQVRSAEASEKQKIVQAFLSDFPGKCEAQVKPVQDLITTLREKGYTKVGALGLCWGGSMVTYVPELDAMAMAHPARYGVTAAGAEKLNSPTCLLPSANEDEAQMKEFHNAMLTKPVGPQCVLKFYSDCPHGWLAARGDLTLDKGKQKFEEAYHDIITFFTNVL
ncbi:hypothetical protein IAR55_006388 [Kwoniella newhampshirensis]|uniref:Dienelactone hydrolase domain-containing protein n=1 Tax=Kwoniella newhampshirensis TaxID=1651941 RepID=A0AAW0YT66_9TREE